MKVLLDECLPIDFRHHLPGHEVHTAEWAGFKSLRNGSLLREAEAAGYDVFLTVDQGIPRHRRIAVLVVRSRSNQLADLLPLVDVILHALTMIQPGQVTLAGGS